VGIAEKGLGAGCIFGAEPSRPRRRSRPGSVGAIYSKGGFGAEQDDGEAARWLKRAADQRNGDSQFLLGALYWNGEGVPIDPVLAYMWFNLAAAAGGTDAQDARDARDEAEQQMTSEQLAEAARLAREWKPTPEKK
jgi:TPR repeat protein